MNKRMHIQVAPLPGRHHSSATESGMVSAELPGTLSQVIQEARQTRDPVLRQEALDWLWVCCPDIAEQLALPTSEAERQMAF
jgi:hypothetical protein